MTSADMPNVIRDQLREQLLAMADQLTDLTRNNIALSYPDNRKLGLDLRNATPGALGRLIDGESVSIAELFPKTSGASATEGTLDLGLDNPEVDVTDVDDAGSSAEGDPQALRAAKKQHKDAVTLLEEKGVKSYWYASHAIRWSHLGKSYRAPLFVTRAEIVPMGGGGNFGASIDPSEPTRVNPSLETYFKVMFELDIALEDEENAEGFISVSLANRSSSADRLTGLIGGAIDVELEADFQVLDNFNFTKLPMITDLKSEAFLELALQDPVILAMLDLDHGPLASQSLSLFSESRLDDEHPGVLPLVADANASQLVAIKTVLDGSHLVIQGPPGTGKSQTIANSIALLASEGKRVLFVAEKQAAILAVSELLDAQGLGHLVLPLNGETSSRRAMARIQQNLDRASSIRPVEVDTEAISSIHERLADRRRYLNEVVPPSDASVLDLVGLWSSIPSDADNERILDSPTSVWVDAVPSGFQRVKDLAQRMSASGYLDSSALDSPWAQFNVPESLSNADLEAGLRQCRSEMLAANLRSHLEQVWMLSLDEATKMVRPLVDFASGELLVTEPLSDDQVFEYARAYNLGPINGEDFRSTESILERFRRRSEFKKLLRPDALRPRTSIQTLATARLIISSSGLQRPGRDVATEMVEAGQWLSNLCSTITHLSVGPAMTVASASEAVDGALRDLDAVPRVREWSRIRSELDALDLGPDVIETFGVGMSQRRTCDLLVGALAGRLVRRHLRSHSMLGVQEPSELAREFSLEDRNIFSLGAQRVAAKSAAWTRTRRDEAAEADRELRNQISKRRGGMTIRRLFHEIPNAVLAANPCVAMSPLQVSSYLPRMKLFDVVIFDEASQVTPVEAIPALARGSMVVVAGDKHQLPPTDFFATQVVVPGLDVADTESVLKKLEVVLPNQWLNVHYRSTDNRLIAVSAEHVYWALSRLRLLTVPSAVRREDCLKFIEVDSDHVSMRGTRTSGDDEIQVVVEEVFKHAERSPGRSLGVITLSREHSDRVELAIERARQDRRDLDAFFNQEGKRKFFVKNIERVQGDERDSIIISTGYQKNASGRLPQTFGPIGKREGGYRRVNVMISRAKVSMTLIAAFNSGDISIRDVGYGVELLHTFFRFMETGGQVLANAEIDEQPMNPFELSIFEEISARGIEAKPQLGVSGYWIDFALVHPEKPGAYVLAVEADGARYHSTLTARERDRLRQEHLEAKGFRFHRVWSTDWFRNRRSETDKIVEAFEKAVRQFDLEEVPEPAQSRIAPVATDDGVGVLPSVPATLRGRSIDQIPYSTLDAITKEAKGLNPNRAQSEVIELVFQALGYSRRGSRIVSRLQESADRVWREH